ncbi:hypothetical protein BJF85_00495 [Saccharomonospora sp. CUA-673]|uniref:hypothetical protein n=1 Tax=Saccharomonospora sp. CUA-673 TaxID=1904969 RepID=UPI00096912D1|nr:hypothetical protein [Saccharomonospora sp. CUA-673]OLT46974.1 hypothetical protein BJF85_00495 [Saccharomonospora sp. CUA-673]
MADFHNVPYNRDTGYTVPASDWNNVAENTVYAKEALDAHADRIGSLEDTTSDDSTGNLALGFRLGTGVTDDNSATAQFTAIRNTTSALTDRADRLDAEVFHDSRGNRRLNDRVTLIESTPPSERIVWITGADFDPNAVGMEMQGTATEQPYHTPGGPIAISFPNPEKVVRVTAWVSYGAYLPGDPVNRFIRGYVRPEVSFDNGNTWNFSSSNPWCGVAIRSGQSTVPERSAVGSTSYSSNNNGDVPTGGIYVGLRAVSDGAPNGNIAFYRVKLSVAVTEATAGRPVYE